MARANRQRWTLVVAASVAAHGAILALLALNAPNLNQAVPPPEFEVTIVPRYVPAEKARPLDKTRPPERVRAEQPPAPPPSRPLVPRLTARPDEELSVAPLVTPYAAGRTGEAPGTGTHPAPAPPGSQDQLRNALRRSTVGCANADSVLLSKAERENCFERLGKGAKDAPFIEPPMSRDKRQAFDEAAAKKRAYQAYKRGNMPPGVTQKDGGPQMRELPPIWPPPR